MPVMITSGFCAFDFVEDRREIGRVGRDTDVIEDFQADRRQAVEIFRIERPRPGGVFAHDDGGFHVEAGNQHVLAAAQLNDACALEVR